MRALVLILFGSLLVSSAHAMQAPKNNFIDNFVKGWGYGAGTVVGIYAAKNSVLSDSSLLSKLIIGGGGMISSQLSIRKALCNNTVEENSSYALGVAGGMIVTLGAVISTGFASQDCHEIQKS